MTKELIESARERAMIGADVDPIEAAQLLTELADALEAKTGVRVDMSSAVGVETQLAQGEPNGYREALVNVLVMSPMVDHIFGDLAPISRTATAILSAGFSRAAVPDAATEETCAERMERKHGALAHLRDVLKSAEAERDAALAAVGRVRALIAEWQHEGPSGPFPDRIAIDVGVEVIEPLLAALDGAPEPEWEYTDSKGNPGPHHLTRFSADPATLARRNENRERLGHEAFPIYRRRKAGPWLPVEGESKP